jgi:hypothetical protein
MSNKGFAFSRPGSPTDARENAAEIEVLSMKEVSHPFRLHILVLLRRAPSCWQAVNVLAAGYNTFVVGFHIRCTSVWPFGNTSIGSKSPNEWLTDEPGWCTCRDTICLRWDMVRTEW